MGILLVRLLPESLRIEFSSDLWKLHNLPSGAGWPHRTQTPGAPLFCPLACELPLFPEFNERLPGCDPRLPLPPPLRPFLRLLFLDAFLRFTCSCISKICASSYKAPTVGFHCLGRMSVVTLAKTNAGFSGCKMPSVRERTTRYGRCNLRIHQTFRKLQPGATMF
jgi:hypothetical protein